DLREVQGALASAVTELLRWQQRTALSEHPGEEELAFQLIRITYNRWQRRDRSDRPLRQAAERGASPVDDRGTTALAAFGGKNPWADEDFVQQIAGVVDEVLGDLNDRDRAIVRCYLDRQKQTAIADALGCHRATVARVIDRFRDRVKRLIGDG